MEQGNKFESETEFGWSSPRLIQLGAAVNSRAATMYYPNETTSFTGGITIYLGPSGAFT